MPVIINELTVEVATENGGGGGSAPASAPALTPLDIAEVLERQARQALRLFAH